MLSVDSKQKYPVSWQVKVIYNGYAKTGSHIEMFIYGKRLKTSSKLKKWLQEM